MRRAAPQRADRPLPPLRKADNAEHRRVRAREERTLARMKNYKIFRDCHCKGNGLNTAVQAAATMHNLAMAACLRQPGTGPQPAGPELRNNLTRLPAHGRSHATEPTPALPRRCR